MKLKSRMEIADRAAAIARATGARVDILPRGHFGDARYTGLRADWPDIHASFDIDGANAPGVLVSFHSAKRDLRPARVFDSISEWHRRKATTWCDTLARFESYWPVICGDIQRGDVFAP